MEVEARVERVRVAYEAVHAPLWRAVLAYSGSADVADEAVAEAFAQLLRRGDGVDDPAAWAWRSAFRIAAGELKRRADGGRRPGAVPDVGVSLAEPALDLIAALRHLTDQQRRLRRPVRPRRPRRAPEPARLLGTTAATVRVQRMRARRRLRDLLEDHDA